MLKHDVCKQKFPSYTPEQSHEYTFRQASCSKKQPPRMSKKHICNEIKKVLSDIEDEGFLPDTGEAYMEILRTLNRKTLKPKLADFTVDLAKSAIVYQCTSECLREFCKDPLPVRQKAFALVVEWREKHKLQPDSENVMNPTIVATLLKHASAFFE